MNTVIKSRHNVLIVEDESDQAALLARWIERDCQLNVDIAYTVRQGIDLLSRRGYSAVLADYKLPDACGLQVVRASKEADPSRPVLVMTASEHNDCVLQSLRHKADDFIRKPVRRSDVIDSLSHLLATHSQKSAQRTRVVAIGAHPDDVEIGCGGALARHRAAGHEVVVVVLTGGEHGGIASSRRLEAERATNILGAELVFGTFRDTQVPEGPECIQLLQSVFARVSPNLVYTHTPNDNHQDHRSAFRATSIAAREIPNLLCYQSPSSTIDFRPSHFVDVQTHLLHKLELIRSFESQTTKRPYLTEETIRATALYWGRFAGYMAVEPFEVIRSVQAHDVEPALQRTGTG